MANAWLAKASHAHLTKAYLSACPTKAIASAASRMLSAPPSCLCRLSLPPPPVYARRA